MHCLFNLKVVDKVLHFVDHNIPNQLTLNTKLTLPLFEVYKEQAAAYRGVSFLRTVVGFIDHNIDYLAYPFFGTTLLNTLPSSFHFPPQHLPSIFQHLANYVQSEQNFFNIYLKRAQNLSNCC